MNVGSGGGAAAAPAAGGAAAAGGGAAEEAPKEEEKEEGEFIYSCLMADVDAVLTVDCREGRVGRGHGLRSFRLNDLQHSAHKRQLEGQHGLDGRAYRVSSRYRSYPSTLAALPAVFLPTDSQSSHQCPERSFRPSYCYI